MKPLDEEDLELLTLVRDGKCSLGLKNPNDAAEVQALAEVQHRLERLEADRLISGVHAQPNFQSKHRGPYVVLASSITPRGMEMLRLHDSEALMRQVQPPLTKRLATDLRAWREEAEREIHELTQNYAARGRLTSGIYVEDVNRVLSSAINRYVERSIDRWMRVLRNSEYALTNAVRAKVAEAFGPPISNLLNAAHAVHGSALKRAGMLPSIAPFPSGESLLTEIADRLEYEWLHPAEAGATQRAPTPAANVSMAFHGPVGAVQTGAGTSATVYQSMGVDLAELRRLVDGLERDFGDALGKVLGQTFRDQLTELAQLAHAEKPETTRVRVLASGVATTIMTLGSIPGAVQAAQAILALLGVHAAIS